MDQKEVTEKNVLTNTEFKQWTHLSIFQLPEISVTHKTMNALIS